MFICYKYRIKQFKNKRVCDVVTINIKFNDYVFMVSCIVFIVNEMIYI